MSKIEWTDETWNPIAGCSKVSAGCTNCYAETMAARLEAMGQAKYAGLTVLEGSHRVWTGKVAFDEKALLEPLRRKKPTTYFVNSMSDLFHEGVTDEQIDRIFAVMALCPQHTFQVLTKRPQRMRWYLSDDNPRYSIRRIFDAAEKIDPEKGYVFDCDIYKPLLNVWLGVSVENQATADERIPPLLQTPAVVRFISAEPLLGPVKLPYGSVNTGPGSSLHRAQEGWCDNGLDWVIVGGESGPGARPMHPDWARSLRDQCEAAGVAFFFKQWGEWKPISEMPEPEHDKLYVSNKKAPEEWQQGDFDGIYGRRCTVPVEYMNFCGETGLDRGFHLVDGHGGMTFFRVGKKSAGALLDGREWRQMPGEAR